MAIPYSPYEKRSLLALMAGLEGGLDPQMALGLYQGTMGEFDARRDERRSRLASVRESHNQALSGLQNLAVQQALAGVPSDLVGAQLDAAMQAIPGFREGRPFAENLQGQVGEFMSSPGMAQIYAQQGGGANLDPDDLAAIDSIVASAQPASHQTGDGAFHAAWTPVAEKFRALGYTPDQIETGQQYFTQQWLAAGGPQPSITEQQLSVTPPSTTGTGPLGPYGPMLG